MEIVKQLSTPAMKLSSPPAQMEKDHLANCIDRRSIYEEMIQITDMQEEEKFSKIILGNFTDGSNWKLPGDWDCVTLQLDWILVIVGRDRSGHEYLRADTGRERFLLNAESLTDHTFSSKKQCKQWVYLIGYFAEELLEDRLRSVPLIYGQFCIKHGLDINNNEFVIITMPGMDESFLFRNPNNRSSVGWHPAGAEKVKNGLLYRHKLAKKTSKEILINNELTS